MAIKLDPKLASAYNNRGAWWEINGRNDKAIDDYGKAIELDPKYALAYDNRGNVYCILHEYDKAIDDFDKAIELAPKYAKAHNSRAWLRATCLDEKLRDGKQAVDSATRACELTAWKNPGFLDTLAASYAEAGDFEAAVKWQRKALGLLPKIDDPLRKELESHLTLFEAKKSYHETPKPARAGDESSKPARP
jgi:tetratricopeptide (TPR) repeat protein